MKNKLLLLCLAFSCWKPGTLLCQEETENVFQERTVTVEAYCTFLNETAENQAVGCSFIERSGGPGSYHYQVMPGEEKRPMPFLSCDEAIAYCDWKNESLSWPAFFLFSSCQHADIDHALKSNLLTFQLRREEATIHQAGGPEVAGIIGAEEIGEDLIGLALLLGLGTGERSRSPSPSFVERSSEERLRSPSRPLRESPSASRTGSPDLPEVPIGFSDLPDVPILRKGKERAGVKSEEIEPSRYFLDESIGNQETPVMIYERGNIRYLEGESNPPTQPLIYQQRVIQHPLFKDRNAKTKLASKLTWAYEQAAAAESRGSLQVAIAYRQIGEAYEKQVAVLEKGDESEIKKWEEIAKILEGDKEWCPGAVWAYEQAAKAGSKENIQVARAYHQCGEAYEKQVAALERGDEAEATKWKKVAEALGIVAWAYEQATDVESKENSELAEWYRQCREAYEKQAEALVRGDEISTNVKKRDALLSRPSELEKEFKDPENDDHETAQLLKQWPYYTASEKKSEVAKRWYKAQEAEQAILEEEKEKLPPFLAGRVACWDKLIIKIGSLKKAWDITAELYRREKDNPPYWIKFRWLNELAVAENKTRWWEAQELYYKAQRAEVETYSLQEKIENDSWNKVIPRAINTLSSWKAALQSFQDGCEKAQEQFQEEWKAALRSLKNKEQAWYETVLWYAEQGGRLTDPNIVELQKQRSVVYVAPSPLDKVSASEMTRFPSAQLIDHKVFYGPLGEAGEKVHVRILKREMTKAYLRVEEVITPVAGVVLRKEMAGDHFLVTLNEGLTEEDFLQWLKEHGYKARKVTKSQPLYRLYFHPASERQWEAAWEKAFDDAQELGINPEPNFYLGKCSAIRSNGLNSINEKQWNLTDSHYGIKALEAWFIKKDAPSIKVAICDTGIHHTHPDLQDNINEDIFYNALDPRTRPFDQNGHGTIMAGIIGAIIKKDEFGVAGIVGNIKLIDFKCRDEVGLSDRFIAAIDKAIEKEVDILNCSFSLDECRSDVMKAINRAKEAGIIIVASAGNADPKDPRRHRNHDEPPYHYPSFYKYHYPSLAVKHDNMIVVAATRVPTKKEPSELWEDSFYGAKTVDIGAPGESIWSTALYSWWNPLPFSSKGFDCYHGSSAAAAHVTGALTLLKAHCMEQGMNLTPGELIKRLCDNADTVQQPKAKIIGDRRLNLADALTNAKGQQKIRAGEESKEDLDNRMPPREEEGQETEMDTTVAFRSRDDEYSEKDDS